MSLTTQLRVNGLEHDGMSLHRYVAVRLFIAFCGVVLLDRVVEGLLRPGPLTTVFLIVIGCLLLVGVFHVLVGRRIWTLIRADRRLRAGDLAHTFVPVSQMNDKIDWLVAVRNHTIEQLTTVIAATEERYHQTDQARQQWANELEALYAVTRALMSEHNVDVILETILAHLVTATGAARAAVLLLSSDAHRLSVEAAHRVPPEEWPELAAALSTNLLTCDPVTGACALRCDPLDRGSMPNPTPSQRAAEFCFPLRSRARELGGIYLSLVAEAAPPTVAQLHLIEMGEAIDGAG